MIIINRPRQMGKTTELIKKAAESGAVIVCHNPKFIHQLAKKMGYNHIRPAMSYTEFLHTSKRVGKGKDEGAQEVYIDDYELFLRSISDGRCHVTTLTTSEPTYQEWDNKIRMEDAIHPSMV